MGLLAVPLWMTSVDGSNKLTSFVLATRVTSAPVGFIAC
jgi:hypothetical protein